MISYFSYRVGSFADTMDSDTTQELQVSAVCLSSLSKSLYTLDRCSFVLTEKQARSVFDDMMLSLRCLQELSLAAYEANRTAWHLRPKHRYFWHLAKDILRTRLNPRKTSACWEDETFLGKMKWVGKSCHGRTASLRILERHFISVAIRWSVPDPRVHIDANPLMQRSR